LVRICTDMGLEEAKEYKHKLSRLDSNFTSNSGELGPDFSNTGAEGPLPPSLQTIRLPTKQGIASILLNVLVNQAAFKVDQDLFHEDVNGILPE
jgi:hypothetical protein